MTKADLSEFQSEWIEPISTNYHGYDIFELPPPGQGFAALEMLNILEACVPRSGTSLAAIGPSDPQYWHYLVEAKKLAYADLDARNGDPKFVSVPLQELLSKPYAACPIFDRRAAAEDRPVNGVYRGGSDHRRDGQAVGW